MSEILVIGHSNPDTDAICSAIGYAEFKRRTGMPEAIAARCGDTNDRIDFVLKTFGMPAPKFVADVSAKDLRRDAAESPERAPGLHRGGSAAIDGRKESPHAAGDGRGAKMPRPAFVIQVKQISFPGGEPARTIRAKSCHRWTTWPRPSAAKWSLGFEPEREDELILMIGAMREESFGAAAGKISAGKILRLVGDRGDIQSFAIRSGVRVLVVTGGGPVEQKTIEAARKNKVSVIVSPHDTATTASLCRAAVSVRHVLNEEFLCFRENAPLAAVREEALSSGYLAFPVLNGEGGLVGILSKTDFLKTVTRKLILVDHNELSQAVQGADEVEIIEIIDHHRIGALVTQQPIFSATNRWVRRARLSPIVFSGTAWKCRAAIAGSAAGRRGFRHLEFDFADNHAQRDTEILKQLEEISGINAREFTEKLFASGSLLTLKSAPQAIRPIARNTPRTTSNSAWPKSRKSALYNFGSAKTSCWPRWKRIARRAGLSFFHAAGHRRDHAKFAAARCRRRKIHQAHQLSAPGIRHLRTARRRLAQKTTVALPHALPARNGKRCEGVNLL